MEQEKKTRRKKNATAESVDTPTTNAQQPTVHSFRITDETFDSFNALKAEMKVVNTDEAFRVMVNSFTMTAAREALPERASEIAEFELLARRLIDGYTHSLLLCQDAEERARDTVKGELDHLNQVIAQLSQMQAQSEQKVKELSSENLKLQEELRQVKAERDALQKSQSLDSTVTSRLDDLQKQLAAVLGSKA